MDGGFIFFTAVNGMIIIVNKQTLKVEEIIDLNIIEDLNEPLGWCRGISIKDEIAYIDFSRVRKTRIKENVSWMLKFSSKGRNISRSRVVAYNLFGKSKINKYVMPKGSMDAIYSVMAV